MGIPNKNINLCIEAAMVWHCLYVSLKNYEGMDEITLMILCKDITELYFNKLWEESKNIKDTSEFDVETIINDLLKN